MRDGGVHLFLRYPLTPSIVPLHPPSCPMLEGITQGTQMAKGPYRLTPHRFSAKAVGIPPNIYHYFTNYPHSTRVRAMYGRGPMLTSMERAGYPHLHRGKKAVYMKHLALPPLYRNLKLKKAGLFCTIPRMGLVWGMTKWSYLIEADDDPKVKSVVKMLKAYDVRRFTHWKKALDLVNTLNKGGPSYILVFHTPATSQYAVEWMTVVKPIPDGFEVGLQKHGRYPTGGSTKMSLSADSIEDPDSGLREFTKFGLFKRGPAGGWRSWA